MGENPGVEEFTEHMTGLFYALATGWVDTPATQRLRMAAIGHAMAFETWRSLTGNGLSDGEASELMVGFVAGVGESADSTESAESTMSAPLIRPRHQDLGLLDRLARSRHAIRVVDLGRAGGEHRADRAVLGRRQLDAARDRGRRDARTLDLVDDVDAGVDLGVLLALLAADVDPVGDDRLGAS